MYILLAFLLFPLVYYLASCIVCLRHNSRTALKIELPTVSVPFFEPNLVTSGIIRLWPFGFLVDHVLPDVLTKRWLCFCRPDWRIRGKYDVHAKLSSDGLRRLGDVFTIASPGGLILNVGDAEVAKTVFGTRGGWPKFRPVMAPVQMFGPNIFGLEGAEWMLHRKILAPTFNERNYRLVWEESVRQTTCLLDLWSQASHTGPFNLRDIRDPLKTITTKVISYAGFGVRLQFDNVEEELDEPDSSGNAALLSQGPNRRFTYGRAIEAATDDFRRTLIAILLPKWLVPYSPNVLKTARLAYDEFEQYLRLLLRVADGTPNQRPLSSNENLLNAVVRSEKREKSLGLVGFSDEERIGSTFAFSLAGQETLSVSLHNAILLLALHQNTQEWFLEELDRNIAGQPDDPRDWSYELLERLTGPICVMNETLRVRPVIPTLIRTTAVVAQPIEYGGQQYMIPPGTTTALSFYGLHYNRKYWGDDADEYIPARWLASSKDGASGLHFNLPVGAARDVQPRWKGIRIPVPGSFGPFSDGARGCLGRKFAEVEMVAILATIFKEYKVDIQCQPGETYKEARTRVQGALNESSNQLTCSVRVDVGLSLSRRS